MTIDRGKKPDALFNLYGLTKSADSSTFLEAEIDNTLNFDRLYPGSKNKCY